MKKIAILVFATALTCVAFTSDKEAVYAPVFVTRTTLESSVIYLPQPQAMKNVGKVYYKAPYVYVNERYKGVHVINNTNPAAPVVEGFIQVPGCIDMAVQSNIMYLDNAVDLVSFDLTTKMVTSRIKDVFPEPVPPGSYIYDYDNMRPEGYVLVEWKKQ